MAIATFEFQRKHGRILFYFLFENGSLNFFCSYYVTKVVSGEIIIFALFETVNYNSYRVLLNTTGCTNAILLDSVRVEVPAGNFSYLSLHHPGLVSLILITNFGDCDIYVSQFQTKPSYEHDAYCLQSSSCGVDSVVVPERFKRPLSIGIYGHPSHKISKCTLTSYLIDATSDSDDKLDELFITTKYGGITGHERYLEEPKDTSDYESLPFLMVFLYYIYNCLLYILDFSMYAQFTPMEVIQLFLETLLM